GAGDVLSGDELAMVLTDGTAAYDSPDAGADKSVTMPLAQLSLAGTDAGNYGIGNTVDIKGPVGEITPATITGVTFSDGEFTYDAPAHGIIATGVPADATVTYEGNGQVNAGTYTVTARVERPNHNPLELAATLTVKKDQPVITAASTQTHVYDGTAKVIAATV